MSNRKPRDQVLEGELLQSVSKTHSVTAFLQSFFIDILLYGTVFVAGYHKVGPVWAIPPLAILVIKDVWSSQREIRKLNEVIKTLRDEEKHLILADLNQLPPWVHFPDIERCNWLNKLLSHFWPYVCTLMKDKIEKEIEPAISQQIPGFKFQKVSLGGIPPIVSGVKVYDRHVSSSQLLIDANLTYTGDCEFYFTYRAIPGGIQNIELRGPVRIDFQVLQQPPFVGGVEFSFLGHPHIDFTLTGIGSVGFIEETVRKVIGDQFSTRLVFPNKFGTVWQERSEKIMEDPEGVIRINVVKARDLECKDRRYFRRVESDPFAEVKYGSKQFSSRVVESTKTPEWNLWCEFVTGNSNTVDIAVWDKDQNTADDLIGSCSLSVKDLNKLRKINSWIQLEGSVGSVYIRAWFLKISPDIQYVRFPPQDLSFLSSYILTVLVKSAHNLLLPQNLQKPCSSVQLTVGNDTQETETVEYDDNPLFDQTFTFLVNNPEFNKLRVKVVDTKAKSEIGTFSYALRKLLDRKNFEISEQHFPLINSASNSSVVVSTRLRIIKNSSF